MAQAKKAAPAKTKEVETDTKVKVVIDPKEAVRLREEEELSFKEIGQQFGVGKSAAELAYMKGKLTKKDIITFVDLADIADQVVSLRDNDLLSWGQISARTNTPEGSLRKLYRETTGKSDVGNRIGKGGRHPNGVTPPKAVKPAAKATKAPAKAKAPDSNPSKKHVSDMTLAELQTRLNGKGITYGRTGKPEKLAIKTVNKLAKGVIDVTLVNGKARSLGLDNIVKADK